MTVYLVFNVDPKYMESFLVNIFSTYEAALSYKEGSKDLMNIQEWGVD
jgi:hypothetical protein